MTLAAIKKALRLGFHPECFPKVKKLGSGAHRTGYRVGNWVIKTERRKSGQDFHNRTARHVAKRWGVRLAPTHKVRGWEIQPYYKPLTDRQFDKLPNSEEMWQQDGIDFQSANLGRDGRGQLVAFDW